MLVVCIYLASREIRQVEFVRVISYMPSILWNRRTNYANHCSADNRRTRGEKYGAVGADARCRMRGKDRADRLEYIWREKPRNFVPCGFTQCLPPFVRRGGLSINTSRA